MGTSDLQLVGQKHTWQPGFNWQLASEVGGWADLRDWAHNLGDLMPSQLWTVVYCVETRHRFTGEQCASFSFWRWVTAQLHESPHLPLTLKSLLGEFQFCKMKKFWRWCWWRLHGNVTIRNATDLYTWKRLRWLSFMLCVLYHNFIILEPFVNAQALIRPHPLCSWSPWFYRESNLNSG